MLSRQVKRACLDTRWTLPPTFLLPFAATLTTVSHTTDVSGAPDVLINSAAKTSQDKTSSFTPSSPPSPAAQPPELPSPTTTASPIALSDSVKELLPALRAQGPHYITAHIYDRPYLLTAGDTLRLPFLMHGVNPGDVLRLNCASTLGSRDFTLKAPASSPKARSPTASTIAIRDPTPGGTLASSSRVMAGEKPSASLGADGVAVEHFVPYQAKGKTNYLDERLFVCRAVVMGVESEPLRIKEKTKRRQRKVKTVKSKHRFTILKVKEITVKSIEEIEGDA